MSEQEKISIYPIADPELTKDPIYSDLSKTVSVFNLEHFKDHIINKAVILIDTKEDLVNFSIKTIDDEIDLLKEFNKEKKFVPFSEEMIAKVSEGQEFYTIIIQPYLFVQLRNKRDEFIQSLASAPAAEEEQANTENENVNQQSDDEEEE